MAVVSSIVATDLQYINQFRSSKLHSKHQRYFDIVSSVFFHKHHLNTFSTAPLSGHIAKLSHDHIQKNPWLAALRMPAAKSHAPLATHVNIRGGFLDLLSIHIRSQNSLRNNESFIYNFKVLLVNKYILCTYLQTVFILQQSSYSNSGSDWIYSIFTPIKELYKSSSTLSVHLHSTLLL